MQKGTKFISLFWTMKTMISSDFVGECYWAEISQSFSLHNASHRSLCRLFAIHTVSQVIFTFIWQVFTLYRYCRAEVNQCRTWPHGLWRELGACRNVAHASRSDKNPGVDSLGRKNHRSIIIKSLVANAWIINSFLGLCLGSRLRYLLLRS